MRSIHAEIEINASASKVWGILTDFGKYSDWNPFITSMEGELEEGAVFKTTIYPPEGKPMSFKPVCTQLIKNRELRWKGILFIPGLFDGEHIFEIREMNSGKVLFVQRENFRGILLSFLWNQLNTKTKRGFELMNEKIKERAENS